MTGHHTDSGEQYRLAWSLASRRLCVTDGLGRTRYHQWDAQNQVTAYQDEARQVTTFRWSDEERLLLGMTDAQGGKWRYVYDRQGHITETHDPLGRVAQTQWHRCGTSRKRRWTRRGTAGAVSTMNAAIFLR